MSYLEAQPGQQHPSPAGEPSSDVPLWIILLAVAVMVAGAGVAAFVLISEGTAKASGPTYPTTWDPRVAPYVKITQNKRGLTFMHPVAVRFLPEKPFEKTVTADEDKLSAQDRKAMDQYTGLMRALGLIEGDIDLFKASNEVSGAGVLAYYSLDDKTITIRGDQVTPAIGATLVHELTHVLQDQHFGIGERKKVLLKQAEKSGSSAEASVLDAIIEGDAVRVEGLYRDSLPARKRKALDDGQNTASTRASGRMRTKQVPPVMVTLQTAPYTLGQALVQAVAAKGGNGGVDTLFRDAPTEETVLMDPYRAAAGHRKAIELDAPTLEKGDKKLASNEFGVLSWYLMLAERLPVHDALRAADGWGGDEFVAFERGGSSCARLNYTGRTTQDTSRMLGALQKWISAAPGSPATVGLESGLVHFESCDPGKTADVGKDASQEAVNLVATRAYATMNLIKRGASEKRARCVAQRLTLVYSVAQLNDPALTSKHPEEATRMQRLTATCP